MHSGLKSAPTPAVPSDRKERLKRYVQAYWLRPENALWMTLRSETLSRCPLEHPSIDLSCGDGVFTFLHSGGVFDPAFDVFTSVGGLDRVRDHHEDMFDHVDDEYRPPIISPPPDTIDVGTDLKPALLAKAEKLDLYRQLVEHDANRPLPFADGTFRTAYCNAAYWVAEIERFLSELGRITRPGGSIILQVKLDSMRRYTLGAHRSALGDRFLDIIDRGRLESWPTLASQETWETRFTGAGLSVIEKRPFITRTHAHIWDIGLRPIAPLLVRMANALDAKTRAAIKGDWIDLVCELLEPFCDPNADLFRSKEEPAEIQYTLTPA